MGFVRGRGDIAMVLQRRRKASKFMASYKACCALRQECAAHRFILAAPPSPLPWLCSPLRPGAPPADAGVHPAALVPAQHDKRAEEARGGGVPGAARSPLVQGASEHEWLPGLAHAAEAEG